MLQTLAIRDIVLIERLDLEFEAGLCVLTGETGAGKSVVLDALGLALGGRADRALVRTAADQGSVTAVFAPKDPTAIAALLSEQGIAADDPLVLRRVVGADGRSRAFVNDQPVSTGLLRRLGGLLVEVHGQHEQQALLDPGAQRGVLDAFGRHAPLLTELDRTHAAWRAADRLRATLEEELEQARAEETYLRHVADELAGLAPQSGEEETLAAARARLMNREKFAGAIVEALELVRGPGGIEARLGSAQRLIEGTVASGGDGGGELLEPAAAGLERTRVELEETIAALIEANHELDQHGERLDDVEERLFALRAAARKHRIGVDQLPQLQVQFAERLAALDAGEDRVAAAAREAEAARTAFVEVTRQLSARRQAAATKLARAVMAELPPLKLDRAQFAPTLVPLAEREWSADGAERVQFEIATNPGQAPGPLAKIASGGELARLMLALKVVLARVSSTPTLIFDEVDTGIGGATADAVGERLARLGEAVQVLVVTHAPQVAARADHHWRVAKSVGRSRAAVTITRLATAERRDEIARMLAGAKVTAAARAAADSLIRQSA